MRVEDQESLTLKRVKLLSTNAKFKINISGSRPESNFIDLMNWVDENFSVVLNDAVNRQKLVNNRIIMDGQFLTFCELNKIQIQCLMKDALVSWDADDGGGEKFFAQGVFLIKTKDVEFIHAALFHKGNQNEDEVSFFIIVSDDNISKYIDLRNQFDRWMKLRDRNSLTIRVVENDDVPYTKEHSWDDLFLPPNIKNNIKGLVESFLSSKDFYKSKKIPWKRGFFLWGTPGCGKSSVIKTIISTYDFKPVTIISEASNEMVREAFAYAEESSPALLYFEDLDSLFDRGVDVSTFLNLMDGVTAKNGILVIATANNINKFKPNIINRPSRFDRKFEIPLPDEQMALAYLKKWFGNGVLNTTLKDLSVKAVKNKLSYAHIKDLYISSMFEAITHNRKVPNTRDINNVWAALISDKNQLNSTISTDKYLK